MLVLAAPARGVSCVDMRNVCRPCYTMLTVKCSFSMLCTDFGFLFIQRADDCIVEHVLVSFALNVMY